MGTPEFAVPSLERLAARTDIDLCLVVTQPDRKAGRGNRITSPAVKVAADNLGIPVLQTDSLRHVEAKERITALKPSLVVVAAFGMILGKWILELPTYGCVNLHASLLPKFRGASPISAAILAGDAVTGVTLMQMDKGLDTGNIMATSVLPIAGDDTTKSLTAKLSQTASDLLDAQLAAVLAGTLPSIAQPEGATTTTLLRKDDGRIDWTLPADQIERHIRAMWDWPRAWTTLPDGERMQIHQAEVGETPQLDIAELGVGGEGIAIGTGAGAILLRWIQLPGGKPLKEQAIIQKLHRYVGERLVDRKFNEWL